MQRLTSKLSDRLEALRTCRYFEGISEAALSKMARETSLRRYAPGEIVIWEADLCSGLYILHTGRVKLYKISPQGRQIAIKIFRDGDTFNEVPVFDEGTSPVNVAAIGECEIWVVACRVVQNAIAEHPEMAQPIILNLSANLRMLIGLVEELSFYQVTNRLARLISLLPEEQRQGRGAYRLTQDEIAARLGTVREVVSRSLKELERSGAIRVARGKFQIMDDEILKE